MDRRTNGRTTLALESLCDWKVIEDARRELDYNICDFKSEEYVDYDNIVFCISDNCISDYIEMK